MTTITYTLVTARTLVPDRDRIVSALLERGMNIEAATPERVGEADRQELILRYPAAELRCEIATQELREPIGVPQDTEYLEREDRRLLRENPARLYTLTCSAPEGREMDGVLYMVAVADALMGLVGGVILDHASQTAWGQRGWKTHASWTTFRVSDHIRIHSLRDAEETALWMHTLGLVKFGRPEIELMGVHPDYATAGGILLQHIAGFMAEGADIGHGNTLDIGFGTVTFMDEGTFISVFAPGFPTDSDRRGYDSCSLVVIDMEADTGDGYNFINPLLEKITAGMQRGGRDSED